MTASTEAKKGMANIQVEHKYCSFSFSQLSSPSVCYSLRSSTSEKGRDQRCDGIVSGGADLAEFG